MKPSDELLLRAAAQRKRLTTIVGTVRVWHDRAQAAKAWQGWVATRPSGSVSILAPQGPEGPRSRLVDRIRDTIRAPSAGITTRLGAPTPFDATPSNITSRLWLERPARWRVETTADDGGSTGVLVIDDERWEFGVVSPKGVERQETDNSSALTLHAAVAGLIEADGILRVLNLEPAGKVVHAARSCYRLIGSLTDPSDFPVWPADSYELLLDVHIGIMLRFEARSGGAPYANAEFTEVAYGRAISEDAFALGAPPRSL